MHAVGFDRLLDAGVAAVATAEQQVAVGPPAPARFVWAPRALWRPDMLDLLPDQLADRLARVREHTPEGDVSLALHSVILRLVKGSRGAALKLRAYLVIDGRAVTLKVWSNWKGRSPGAREREVRQVVAAIDHYRTPRMLAHGRVGDVEYLLEPVVPGRHPLTPPERADAAIDLGTALTRAYAQTACGDRRLSDVVHIQFRSRLETVLSAPDLAWDRSWGRRDAVARRLLRLVDRDRALPVAIGHGDLVASNVIKAPDGRHYLIDWEQGRVQPVAFDLAKLFLSTDDPPAVLRRLEGATRAFAGRGLRRYRWREQVALGVAQWVSWAAGGRRSAAAAGHLHRFEHKHRQRLGLLAELLRR